jgi:hypothetical protein
MLKNTVALLIAAVATSASAASIDLTKLPPPSKKEGVTYSKDIRPILEASCFQCHGDAGQPRAGLRLDTLENVLKGSRTGKILTPGESEKSQLVISVSRLDPRSAMPQVPRARRGGPGMPGAPGGAETPPANRPGDAAVPPGSGNPPGMPQGGQPQPKNLTPEEVGLVRAWIDQGAK